MAFKILILIVFLGSFAQSQQSAQAGKKLMVRQSQPIAHLSPYMRETGLLYVETVERAVAPEIVNAQFSDEQFEIAKSIEDRIEMQVATDADKDFYKFGLISFTDRAKLRAHLAAYGLLLAGSREPDASQKKEANDQKFAATVKLYISCDSELRSIIKAGEYKSLEAIIKACDPSLLEH